ncbi:hypothetical protein BDV59DRAFT_153874 [Aspergillus ambiguus]|uniref:uncharacterized protein n=1 Tax=Aspergillus ambiguus TaxID=176160 RepID=UPI003CCCAFEA
MVGQRAIFAFDDALISRRATRIIVEHFHRGELPPGLFPWSALSVEKQNLIQADMRAIHDREHLMDCIEGISSGVAHKAHWIKNVTRWRNFRRTFYQSLLFNAVLCRAYQEPFHSPRLNDLSGSFLENFGQRCKKAVAECDRSSLLSKMTPPRRSGLSSFNGVKFEHSMNFAPQLDFPLAQCLLFAIMTPLLHYISRLCSVSLHI